jgi:hypothetical protein
MPLLSGNPVNAATLQVTLMAGDDYKAADGRALLFANPNGNWPNLAGAAIWFVGQAGNFPPQQASGIPLPLIFPAALIPPVAGTVVTPTGANQAVQVELPAASTSFVRPSPSPTDLYSYAVYAVLANGDIVTLQTGPLQVLGVSA